MNAKATITKAEEPACNCEEAAEKIGTVDKVILFSTATCPNCKAAEMFLQKAGVIYEKLLANENPELVAKYGITQAPTLVVISGDSFEKIPNLSNIKAFTERI